MNLNFGIFKERIFVFSYFNNTFNIFYLHSAFTVISYITVSIRNTV
jgi:hypothetical protein